jgi:hypothetical protein
MWKRLDSSYCHYLLEISLISLSKAIKRLVGFHGIDVKYGLLSHSIDDIIPALRTGLFLETTWNLLHAEGYWHSMFFDDLIFPYGQSISQADPDHSILSSDFFRYRAVYS